MSALSDVADGLRLTFDLQRSNDWQGEANGKAGGSLYNVIDWRGEFRGQVALKPEEAQQLTPLRSQP